jgi:hypothetical protein
MADVNGDGKPDYCRFASSTSFLVCDVQTDNTFETNWVGTYVEPTETQFMADVNGDGRADYCRFLASNMFSCALLSLEGYRSFVDGNFQTQLDPGYGDMPRRLVDVNGDGRADYCRFVAGSPKWLSCALSTGTGFGQYDFNSNQTREYEAGYLDRPVFMADVNGDGRADYCRYLGPRETMYLSCGLATDTGFGDKDINAVGLDAGQDGWPRDMVDVNGDGRADFCRYFTQPSYRISCALSTGTGFGPAEVNMPIGFESELTGNRGWFLSSAIR